MSGQWDFMDRAKTAAEQQQAYVDAAFQQHLAQVALQRQATMVVVDTTVPSVNRIAALEAEIERLQAELALAKPVIAPAPDPNAMPARALSGRFRGGLISSPGEINGH